MACVQSVYNAMVIDIAFYHKIIINNFWQNFGPKSMGPSPAATTAGFLAH